MWIYRVKVRAWWLRPLFILRGLGTVIDGTVLVLSLGFVATRLEYNILKLQMDIDFKLAK